MDQATVDAMWLKLAEVVPVYALRLLAALAIFVIGKWLAKLLTRVLEHSMQRAHVESTLAAFVKNLVYVGLLIFIVIAALGQMGVQTTSFVALVGAAGLAIGLALQGSLSNFAAGVLVVVFHPFRVGDYVEAAGTKGTVREIQIFHTVLNLADGRTQIVPNGQVMGGRITVGAPRG